MAQTTMMIGAMIENGTRMIDAHSGTVDRTIARPTRLPR